MKVKSESEVAQSCLTLSDPMDCSLPGSSTHGIFQARVLEWGAIAFSIRASYVLSIVFRHETIYTHGQEDKLIVLQYVRKKIKMALGYGKFTTHSSLPQP